MSCSQGFCIVGEGRSVAMAPDHLAVVCKFGKEGKFRSSPISLRTCVIDKKTAKVFIPSMKYSSVTLQTARRSLTMSDYWWRWDTS